MTDIKLKDIKPGDTVTLKPGPCKVLRNELCGVLPLCLAVPWSVAGGWFTLDAIASHTPAPRPLAVGDIVLTPRGTRAEIKGLSEGFAWLKFPHAGYETYSTDALTPAEPDNG